MTSQHLKDLVTSEGQPSPLLTAIIALVNVVVAGDVPDLIKPFFFGGRFDFTVEEGWRSSSYSDWIDIEKTGIQAG